jgi:hypothetical protein
MIVANFTFCLAGVGLGACGLWLRAVPSLPLEPADGGLKTGGRP